MNVPADSGWAQVELPEEYVAVYTNAGLEPPQGYRHAELFALVSRDDIGPDDWRWHVSVRYGDPGRNGRVPNWEELVECAHALRPGVVFVIGIPPRSWWMNLHPHVLHLYETRDEKLIAQWRAESRGDRPT